MLLHKRTKQPASQPSTASLMAELEDPRMMIKVIAILSSLLQRVSERNDLNHPFDITQKISPFHGITRPTISIQCYLERIFKYADCSPSCFVVAYLYLDRFTQKQTLFPINSFSVHRLLITSVLVSAKFMDDIFYNNAYYAKVGGISTTEMNLLEVHFLFGLGFQLNVTTTTFQSYFSNLQREMLLSCPPLHLALPSPLNIARTELINGYFNEEESTHQQQLAV